MNLKFQISNFKSGAPYPPLRLAWLIWSLGSLFYVIGFFHRLAPAVMTQELMRDFNISAAALGNLSGFYFYSYWLMQIPTGILADSWGPRRLLTFGALGSAVGAVLFALSPGMIWACSRPPAHRRLRRRGVCRQSQACGQLVPGELFFDGFGNGSPGRRSWAPSRRGCR